MATTGYPHRAKFTVPGREQKAVRSDQVLKLANFADLRCALAPFLDVETPRRETMLDN